MAAEDDGWVGIITEMAAGETRYRYQIDGTLRVPDPASRFQPDDVHGPSEVIDPCSWQWRDGGWRGRPWHEAVIYELHVGTFSVHALLGLRRRAAGRARQPLRPPGRAQGVDRGGSRPRADGASRRGVQPLRARRQLSSRLRTAILHRSSQDAMGRGH